MKQIKTAIIGGGAAGLFLATTLSENNGKIMILERGERLGRKLSATGNGQGNVTNADALNAEYFSSEKEGAARASEIVRAFDDRSLKEYLRALGLLLITDSKGRVYPAGRQASSITDALRFCVERKGVEVCLQTRVVAIEKAKKGFILTAQTPTGTEKISAENVALCAGGKAAKNFGTDGSAYALATDLGHTVTPLYPSLVQLKTDTTHSKTLKGIRINDGLVRAEVVGENARSVTARGDIIFTDYGVSGDAIFRVSAFIAKWAEKTRLELDFLPTFTEEEIYTVLAKKHADFPSLDKRELLGGIVNNQVGRAVLKRAEGDLLTAAKLVKAFPLSVTGSLGFDYAQVTKGGIPLSEMDRDLQSKFCKGLYFAGEILDVDGQCGGFNLQWAYSSARVVAKAIDKKYETGGQV